MNESGSTGLPVAFDRGDKCQAALSGGHPYPTEEN